VLEGPPTGGPIQVAVEQDRISFQDSPGCFWLFGGFFVVVGGLAAAAVTASLAEAIPALHVVGGYFLALAAIGAGLYLIYDAPISAVEADRRTRTLILRRRGFLRREERRIPLEDIRSVGVVTSDDIDGEPVYASAIQLADGTQERLTRLWIHDRGSQEAVVRQLAAFLAAAA
jgi:hypothetical protein